MFLHLSVKFHEFTFFWPSPIMWNNDVISDVKIIARDQSMKENPQKSEAAVKEPPKKLWPKLQRPSLAVGVCVCRGGGEHAPLLVQFCFHSFICSCPQKYAKQESIPLECVPSAAVAISRAGEGGLCLGGCLHGVSA